MRRSDRRAPAVDRRRSRQGDRPRQGLRRRRRQPRRSRQSRRTVCCAPRAGGGRLGFAIGSLRGHPSAALTPTTICRDSSLHFEIVTRVTALTRLLASTKLPSRVTEVLRTMFPPPGIAQLWNFSVLGSKRTTVFGVVPDSLYQITSLIAEMP